MRVKKCDWIDLKTHRVIYGIQVHNGEEWCYTPLAYVDEAARDKKLAEVRKTKPEDWQRIPSPIASQKGGE